MRSLTIATLTVLVLGAGHVHAADNVAAAPARRPTLFLERGSGWGLEIGGKFNHSELRREFIRQAFLIAAREELGWQTRDVWLGERPLENTSMALDVVSVPGEPNTIEVLSGDPPRQRRREVIVLPNEITNDDGSEIALVEKLSRERFPEVIRKALGASAFPQAPWGNAAIPAEVERRLEEFTFYSQFAAVRAIHAAIAPHGESPQLLGGLIRGYANLGMLTEWQCNSSYRACYARALLYAERWQAREPKSPAALWHRAYAEAAAGFHDRAIRDFASADKLLAASGKPAEQPTWAPLIRAFVNFDLRPLQLKNDDRHAQLAALLTVIAEEQAESTEAAIQDGLKSLEFMPDCYRIHDDVVRLVLRPRERELTKLTPSMFAVGLYRNVANVPDCPAAALRIANPRMDRTALLTDEEAGDEQADRIKLIAALRSADHSPEPTGDNSTNVKRVGAEENSARPSASQMTAAELGWDALAFWIEETGFQQIYQRLVYIRETMRHDPADYISGIKPLLEHHRFWPVVQTFQVDDDVKKAAMRQIRNLGIEDVDFHQNYLGTLFERFGDSDVWDLSCTSIDDNANDRARLLSQERDEVRVARAEQLLRYSPRNPQALAVLIEERWDQYKNRAEECRALAEQYPRLALAFGRQAVETNDYQRAKALFEQAVAQDPSFDTYSALADAYRLLGDIGMFEKTYQTYFKKIPNVRLNYPWANDTIAKCFIRRGEFDKAAPYADKAAESWAAWAMLTDAVVKEHFNKFDDAEKLYEGVAGNYGWSSTAYWLAFCLRTGHGKKDEARKGWDDFKRRLNGDPVQTYGDIFAVIDVLDGKDAEAQPIFQHGFERAHDPWLGLCAAMEADRLGNSALRDKLLASVRQQGGQFNDPVTHHPRQNLIDLTSLLVEAFKQKKPAKIDIAIAERICRAGRQKQIQMASFIVGEYLSQHGKMEGAAKFWLHALDDPHSGEGQTEMAGFRLRQEAIKPEDFELTRKLLGASELWFSD